MGSAFLNKHIAAFVYKKTETKTKTKKTKTNTRGAIRSFLEKNIAAFMDKKTETKKEGAIRSLKPDKETTLLDKHVLLLLGVHRASWTVVGCGFVEPPFAT